MQSEIKSIFRSKDGAKLITLFGYASGGVIGLEILGLGNKGRLLKEKINYLTKIRKIKIPPKRYVISVENIEMNTNNCEIKYMEFPILILFWQLAGILNINQLEECLCLGEIKVNGEIIQPNIYDETLLSLKLRHFDLGQMKIITEENETSLLQIASSLLLSNIPNLNYKTIEIFSDNSKVLNYIDKPSATPMNSLMA
jgi:hypothetical protein